MTKIFSQRTDWDLSQNPLAQLLAKREKEGLPILNLIESNPTRCSFNYPEETISKALIQPGIFSYEPQPKGLLKSREAISSYYLELNAHVSPEQIFLTASTSEAYSFIFRLITHPKDSILVPSPSYPLFNFLCDLNDLELSTYPLIYENGWHLDLTALKSSIKNSTRAILVVHPNNPTGSYIKKDEMIKLIQLAKEHDLALISDEVFFDFAHKEDLEKISFCENQEVLTFVLNGLSKICALPQMKVSWIIANGPEKILKEAMNRLEVIADTFLSVGTPIQLALPEILKSRNIIQKQITSRLKSNSLFLKEKIRKYPSCEYLKNEGGWYAILKVPRTQSDDEWAMTFLEEGILIHPGHFYNFSNDGYLVISLLTHPAIFEKGITTILERMCI